MLVKASKAVRRVGWFGRIRQSRLGAKRISDGWNESFRLPRHTYCTHAEACMLFVRWTASLGAIKDIDLVPLFLLDLRGGLQLHNVHGATADRTLPDRGCIGFRSSRRRCDC